MGPIRKLLAIALGARTALHVARDRYNNDPASQATLDVTLSRHDMMAQIHHAMLHQLPAAGQVALEAQLRLGTPVDWMAFAEPGAPPIDPAKHPFLAWLLSPQGIAWIMTIVNYVLTTFFHMNPLPPFPSLTQSGMPSMDKEKPIAAPAVGEFQHVTTGWVESETILPHKKLASTNAGKKKK